jgi:hypothetical protein
MALVSEDDWSFQRIKEACPERASKLAKAGTCDELVEALDLALARAVADEDVRIGFDGINNDHSAPRVTVQFPVRAHLYDWFFSARSGYRAQYWISQENGENFNRRVISRFKCTINCSLPALDVVGAHKIRVDNEGYTRRDFSEGLHPINRSIVLNSLDPETSKVWICERLLPEEKGEARTLCVFEGLELTVRRWKHAHAPYPKADFWLDLKGGYVQRDGKVMPQPQKAPQVRARDIHCSGWS